MKKVIENEILYIRATKDEESLNQLITEYKPFVIKVLSDLTNRYIQVENDELLSIGLLAFNEAISRYDEKNGYFLPFARLTIRSRAINYLEKESNNLQHEKTIEYCDYLIQTDGGISDIKLEIMAFEETLSEFSITLDDLLNKAPKHKDTRDRILDLAMRFAANKELVTLLVDKKRLPIKKTAEKFFISPKILKRNKVFIIASILIYIKNYLQLKEYLQKGT